jgi:hypothetical protein
MFEQWEWQYGSSLVDKGITVIVAHILRNQVPIFEIFLKGQCMVKSVYKIVHYKIVIAYFSQPQPIYFLCVLCIFMLWLLEIFLLIFYW